MTKTYKIQEMQGVSMTNLSALGANYLTNCLTI